MSEIPSSYDDEFGLFGLFAVLWDGRWFISVFVASALSIGGGYCLLKMRPCLILGLCFVRKIHLMSGKLITRGAGTPFSVNNPP